MTATETGGPAFPVPEFDGDGAPGMTLRDWFAGQALITVGHLLAHATTIRINGDKIDQLDESGLAKTCYGLADAMLAERSKPKEAP